MRKIDLNCDMGEWKAGQTRNYDAEIMPFVSSCNIACGFHSGSPLRMEQTIRAAISEQVKIGAHPSYNDRENFGRLSVQVDREVLLAEIHYQISALKGMVESAGASLHHVKPHGALYNDMVFDAGLASAFVQLVKQIDPALKVYALAGSPVIDICQSEGMTPVNEGFADRLYERPDQLRSRSFEDAVLHEPQKVLDQVSDFIQGKVRTADGESSEINVESICLHSDTTGAVDLGKKIHHYLQQNNVHISAIL